MNSEDVMGLLRSRHDDPYRYVFLEEVVLVDNRADAVVWWCYHSDVQRLVVYEVKVDRRDWLRELSDPSKNARWRRCASEFIYVAPYGVIQPGEVPKGRGLMLARSTPRGAPHSLRLRVRPTRRPQRPLGPLVATALIRSAMFAGARSGIMSASGGPGAHQPNQSPEPGGPSDH